MDNYLPVVVPFFGAAVILSWSMTCCMVRRTARILDGVQARVEALEAQRLLTLPPQPQQQTPQQQQQPMFVPTVQTIPYSYPRQQPPPPYNQQAAVYYIPPPQQGQVRASAPL